MREVGLSEYEPACIEGIHEVKPTALDALLASASHADQWLPKLDGNRIADTAICVFAPNRLSHPEGTSLEYLGAFPYRPTTG
jgi:hypothetical protein